MVRRAGFSRQKMKNSGFRPPQRTKKRLSSLSSCIREKDCLSEGCPPLTGDPLRTNDIVSSPTAKLSCPFLSGGDYCDD
ncbi:hypothetical protein CDAR_411611 [Caerostris darwini]|uniref:Uncharacterized protein n=1 Tax=Caerostris darwini TaxID=1538125 RepID=A0AAV4MH96_9ARAC|nr:hypothetical protein CDAR_411611 [Caerostris darwini]